VRRTGRVGRGRARGTEYQERSQRAIKHETCGLDDVIGSGVWLGTDSRSSHEVRSPECRDDRTSAEDDLAGIQTRGNGEGP
jgi:hypothetical protein